MTTLGHCERPKGSAAISLSICGVARDGLKTGLPRRSLCSLLAMTGNFHVSEELRIGCLTKWACHFLVAGVVWKLGIVLFKALVYEE